MGTKEGAEKARQKGIEKYGSEEEFKRIRTEILAKNASKGGKKSPTNFKNNPELASRAAKARWAKAKQNSTDKD